MTSLSLYEDLLAPGEAIRLPAGGRMVYVASGELATLHAGTAAFGDDEAELAAGVDGATVLRWELTEWSVEDAKLSAHVELDPWADYAMRCERDGGPAEGPGIGCVLRGELSVDGESVQPFGAFVEPAEVSGRGSFVRVVLVRGRGLERRRRSGAGRDPPLMLRTGGKVLVDQLALHGAELAFCVPGESYLAVLDALYDAPIRLVTCRHEAAAANMAEAYGKLTGRPGICLVTRGPGATHASIGVHTAYQDSTPLILLIGQVGRDMLEREAFQEIDYRRMFNSMTKWVAQIESAERIPELLARAFTVATAGRPGPVVLALPEDMLVDEVDVADPGPYTPVHTHPGRAELDRLRELVDGSERPLVIVGGGKWSAQAAEDVAAFCEANELPVATSFRRQDYVDNGSRVFAGHVGVGIDPALAARVTDADLLLVVGPRLGEMTTGGYTLVEPPLPRQTLVHVHAGAEELGRVYQPALAIHAGSPEFAAAAREACVSETQSPARRAWVEAARADYLRTLEPVPRRGR